MTTFWRTERDRVIAELLEDPANWHEGIRGLLGSHVLTEAYLKLDQRAREEATAEFIPELRAYNRRQVARRVIARHQVAAERQQALRARHGQLRLRLWLRDTEGAAA